MAALVGPHYLMSNQFDTVTTEEIILEAETFTGKLKDNESSLDPTDHY